MVTLCIVSCVCIAKMVRGIGNKLIEKKGRVTRYELKTGKNKKEIEDFSLKMHPCLVGCHGIIVFCLNF